MYYLFGPFANRGVLLGKPDSPDLIRCLPRLHAKDNHKKAQLTINPAPRRPSKGWVRLISSKD